MPLTLVTCSAHNSSHAAGNPVYIAKMTGTDTLSDDCNKVTVNVKLQFLSPMLEPWGPAVPQDEHYGYRILVEE